MDKRLSHVREFGLRGVEQQEELFVTKLEIRILILEEHKDDA